MNCNFISPNPYSIKKHYFPRIYTSTVADSSTISAQAIGRAEYIVSIQCTTGNLAYDATGATCTTASGNVIKVGDTHTFAVKRSDANPNSIVSLFGLTTTTEWQAWILE